MEGLVFDSAINYMDKFGPEILVIQFGFLVILSTIFLWLWFSNRRKYHNLKHAIPANIVKSYLDSIIQNSTSLKSQLFRGGGIDVGGVPSVIPLHNLMGGDSLGMSGAPSTALLEELNQKKAQIASLEAQLSSSQNSNREVEAKLASLQGNLSTAEAKIKELEALLAQSRTSGGGDAALQSEFKMVSKERDDLRDRLKEFEIIADDLANLKRLQQENEQLKKSLAGQGQKIPEPKVEAPKAMDQAEVSDLFEDLVQAEAKNTDNDALEDFLSAPNESTPDEQVEANAEDLMASMDEAPAVEAKPKSEKTPEDLLSEFEKMLG
jgi:predicted nuclease with TOPRIM domain